MLMFYPKRFHPGLMHRTKNYQGLQDSLELCQSVLDEEVKENHDQRLQADRDLQF